MTPAQHAKAKALFAAARALPEDARAAYLEQACAGDDTLLGHVRHLLSNATPLPDYTQTTTRGVAPAEVEERPKDALPSGAIFAERYRIIAPLGSGGMGTVYRAHDQILDQEVALKLLQPRYSQNAEWSERFKNEVRLARGVTHPHVCRVHDIGFADGLCYLSMEYVQGDDLQSLLKRVGRISQDRACSIASQVCMALAALHRQGVLHRDLKPANVMIDNEGAVRLTDFGLATRDHLEGSEALAGTPAYMAPEQIDGREVTVRSDIYALGLLLYELFTGVRAFSARSFTDYRKLHKESSPPTPSSIVDDIPADVERLILQCIEKDPALRPASAEVLALALGGDVLGEMVWRGETPSPSLIAAAGATDRVGLRAVVTALTLCVIGVGLLAGLARARPLLASRLVVKAPVVLADQADTLAQHLGGAGSDDDRAWGLTTAATCRFVRGAVQPTLPCATAESATPFFWHRTSPNGLAPVGIKQVLIGGGRTTLDDPPPIGATGTTLILSTDGKLVAFERIGSPEQIAANDAVSWSPFFTAAGLQESEFGPTEPLYVPRAYADARRAWVDATGVRIEAATTSGVPTVFIVVGEPPPEVGRATAWRRFVTEHAWDLLFLILVASCGPLAYLNLRRGRSDPGGARRLAVFVFLLHMSAWLLTAQHTSRFFETLDLMAFAVFGTIGIAGLFWLFYVALEPYLRRFWPHALVTWSRVLSGRSFDTRVGWHILLGVALGLYFELIARFDQLLTRLIGLTPREVVMRIDTLTPLLGARYSLATILQLLSNALYDALAMLLLVALLRAVIRRPTAAAVAAVLLIGVLYVPRGAHPLVSPIVIGLMGVAVAVWAMTRLGLLVMVVAVFVANMMTALTPGTHGWATDLFLFGLLGPLGLAGAAAWIARQAPPARNPAFTYRGAESAAPRASRSS